MLSLPPPDSKVPSEFGVMGRKANNTSKKISEHFPVSSRSCLCAGSVETRDKIERRRPLFVCEAGKVMPPKEDDGNKVVVGNQGVAIPMKPKIVMLRVSMHCNGCATKVEKHISKIEGVSTFKVDLESKMVVIVGDIVPVEVLVSVSRVKRAEFWG